MEKDLISEIEKSIDSFSKGQKKIAEYIINHYDKAAFITASKLGEVVGVSESTVVRFAVELGYEGYPKLQKALQELIRNKLTSVQRMEIISNKLNEQDILKTVLMADIDKLNKTMEEIDSDSFNKSVSTILNAKKIYIIGTRSCYSIANFLGFYLNHIFPDVKLISTNSASETFEEIYRINENDVVIAISFPRYSRRTINALKYAHEKKSSIIAITDSKNSPITENATYTLTARCDMSSFVDSLVAPLSIINALVVALVMQKKDEVGKTLSDLENIWDEYEVYEKYTKNN